jgi:hypothetical protein
MNRRIIKYLCFVAAACALCATFAGIRPVGASGPCTDSSRACVVSAAQTYLDALKSHDGSQVRLDRNVVRYENGIETAYGAPYLRHQLETNNLLKLIIRLRDIRWMVDGDQANAYYLIDTTGLPGLGPKVSTAHVSERFRVRNGLVTEIEAIFCFAGGTGADTATTESQLWRESILCLRTGPIQS